jgi:branched-subunit amino acid transport protein AzlD
MNSLFIHSIVIIALMTVLTYGARLFPFLLFGRTGKPLPVVTYLGKVLPPAVMMLLLVYCVRTVDLTVFPHGIPEFSSIALAVILYRITKNNLVAMVAATVLYMVMIQVVFA